MIINHNMSAINANGKMAGNSVQTSKSMEKLSSGLRINRAGDDAAGLAISEKMRAQIRGLDQAERNAQDGISLIQTAEGGLSETHSILQRMRELATQASNGTNTDTDRQAMQDEINQLTSEVNRIGNTTEFNTQKILNGGIDSSDETTKTTAAKAAEIKAGGNDLGAAKTLSGVAAAGTVSVATAVTISMTSKAGVIGEGTKIIVNGKEFDASGIILDGTASTNDSKALGEAKAADGTKLSDVVTINTGTANSITLTNKTKGPLGSLQTTADDKLNSSVADSLKVGGGAAVYVNGVGFDISGKTIAVATDADKAATIKTLGDAQSLDGKKLSDVVDIAFTPAGNLKFTSKVKGSDSNVYIESRASGTGASANSTPLGATGGTDLGETNKAEGSGTKISTKVNYGAIEKSLTVATGTTVEHTQAKTAAITSAAGTIAKNTTIVVDGKVFTNSNDITLTGTDTVDGLVNTLGTQFKAEDGTLLKDAATLEGSAAGALIGVGSITIESKSYGPNSSVAVQKDATLTNNAAIAKAQGDGTAIVVNGNSFDLSGIRIDITDARSKAETLSKLKEIVSNGVKLSDVLDLKFNGDKLEMATKTGGSNTTVYFENKSAGADAASTILGLSTADLGSGHAIKGTESTKIVVDNTTFDLGGISVDRSSEASINASIESLKGATAGGTKLGDLVDIKYNEETGFVFTTKSTGSSSGIKFTGAADLSGLGVSSTQVNSTGEKGSDTTVERTGIQAGTAIDTSKDLSIGKDMSFKVAVGTESFVTVNLKEESYNLSNSDANVAKAERDRLVTDLNQALQAAGLDGKVSAAISSDNKLQFISEEGQNLKLEDGRSALSKIGFGSSDLTANGNLQQVVGAGDQGSGFDVSFQIGANKGQMISTSIQDMRASALGITGNAGEVGFTSTAEVTNGTTNVKQEAAVNIMDPDSATKAIKTINDAIVKVAAERGKLGAVQNRLEHTINNLGTSSENLTSAESRIRDVNMAKEMMTYQKNNVLSQAAQAMLAQANQQPQQVLSLLR